MKDLNDEIVILVGLRWYLGIFFASLIFLGVVFTSGESSAQAVPPRVQALQMTSPVAPPPEPPIQKEIRVLKQDVQNKTQAIERKIGIVFPSSQAEWPKLKPPGPGPTISRMLDKIDALEKKVTSLEQQLKNCKGR
jgi:hypothetical protein